MEKRKVIFSKEQIHTFSKTFLLYNIIVIGIPFGLIWGGGIFDEFQNRVVKLINESYWTFLLDWSIVYFKLILSFCAGIIMHELIHALVFLIFSKKGLNSIKFGFIEKPFTPYVHCSSVLPIWAYRIGIIMPGLILGILPAILGMINGSFNMILFGLIFTAVAGGDLMLFKATLAYDGKMKIRDLPEDMGFEIVV